MPNNSAITMASSGPARSTIHVHAAARQGRVEQVLDHALDHPLPAPQRRRREGVVAQYAQPVVLPAIFHEHHARVDARVVGGQGRVAAGQLCPDEDLDPGAAQGRVLGRRQHVVVARQHPVPQRLRPVHGVVLPNPAVDRVRVLEELWVGQPIRFGLTGEHGLVLSFQGKRKLDGVAPCFQAGRPRSRRRRPQGGDGRFAHAGQTITGQDFLGPLRQRLLHGLPQSQGRTSAKELISSRFN